MPETEQAITGGAVELVTDYLDALNRRDLDAAMGFWAEGGLERIPGVRELRARGELREYFRAMFAAFPDAGFETLDVVGSDAVVAIRWRLTGTFAGQPYQGIEPTGSRVEVSGCDVLRLSEGLIQSNDIYFDTGEMARQLGLLPATGSGPERAMTAAFNLRTRLVSRLLAPDVEKVANGVWIVRGGFPKKTMNVYLIEEPGGGVTLFDAGVEAMASGVAAVCARMGGARRVVLGHSHADHRGVAPSLGVPVHCHPDEVADAEGDGGAHYFDMAALDVFKPGALMFPRLLLPTLLRMWDGGPVEIAGTLSEGDEVAGFEVRHFPGHAPGLIGLWRESDRLALCSDALYTLDPQTGGYGEPRVPHPAFTPDRETARESIRKLAALEPDAVWAGHADPVTGPNVREQLERAADTT